MTEVDALHIGGLPRGIGAEFVGQVFAQYGPVHNINLLEATSPEQTHVAATIHMQRPQSQWCIDNLNGNIPQGMETIVYIQRLPDGAAAGGGGMQAPMAVGPQIAMQQSQMPMQGMQNMQQDMQMTMMQQVQQAQQAMGEEQWACSACGFTNAPRNQICGGNGPMGCKAPREQVGKALQERKPQPVAHQSSQRVDDPIDMAAGTVLQAVAHLEQQWDFDKLRWKVATYFRAAAKEIVINGPIEKVVDDFADCAFCRLMSAISDRVWLCQVDFTLLLDAAVKSTLPPEYVASIPMSSLEDAIVKSHDRAFEEARVTPMIWEAIEGRVDGKKAANKVYNAFEVSRSLALKSVKPYDGMSPAEADLQAAALPTMEKIDKFCRAWINNAISEMAKVSRGDPSALCSKDIAEVIFNRLLTADTLPQWLARHLIAENETFAPPHPFLDEYLKEAYDSHLQAWQAAKRAKLGPVVRTHMCWFHLGEGKCSYGDGCQYAHAPEQLHLTVDFKCPDWVREMFPDLGERYDELMKTAEETGVLASWAASADDGWSQSSGEQGKGFGFKGKGFGDKGNGWSTGDKGNGWSPIKGKGFWGNPGLGQGKGCWGDGGKDGWNAGALGKGWESLGKGWGEQGKGCWGEQGKACWKGC